MNLKEILALYDKEQRQEIEYPAMRREALPYVVRHSDLSGREGVVLYSQLNAENADQAIHQQIDYFEKIGQNFEWKYYEHDAPKDLKDRLIAQGFIPGEAEALMVLDLEKVPAALLRPITHDVQRITDPDKLAEIVRVQNQVWGEDHSWLAAKLAKELLNPQGSVYVAYASGEPASCAWIRFSEKGQFASLWGGATIPAHRKQGFYTALVAARTQEARRRGARFLTIDAGPMSRPIVEKFGFQLLTHTYPCDWKVKQPKLLS